MKRTALLASTALLLCAACGGSSHMLQGTVTAPNCAASNLLANQPVIVRNEKSEVIGSTATTPGNGTATQCVMHFATQVPDAKFYSVTVGSHNGPTYSSSDLARQHYTVDLSLP